jgi:hypothetical protein
MISGAENAAKYLKYFFIRWVSQLAALNVAAEIWRGLYQLHT